MDQIAKALALKFLSSVPTVPILPGIFHLTFLVNPGVAFGLLRGQPLTVAVGTGLIILALVWSATHPGAQEKQTRWTALSLGLILGGAAGNLIDRLRFGGVIDFLDFRIWPVFNVADSCLTIGAALLAISFWRKG